MAIYNGSTKLKELYVGNVKIKEAYVGSTCVYRSNYENYILRIVSSGPDTLVIKRLQVNGTTATLKSGRKKTTNGNWVNLSSSDLNQICANGNTLQVGYDYTNLELTFDGITQIPTSVSWFTDEYYAPLIYLSAYFIGINNGVETELGSLLEERQGQDKTFTITI